MQITDPIADMLTRIRNANTAKHKTVDIPASNMKKAIADILLAEGYVRGVQVIEDGKLGSLAFCDLYMKYWREPSYYGDSVWRGTKTLDGGGALMNQAIHMIDLLIHINGAPEEVFTNPKCERLQSFLAKVL